MGPVASGANVAPRLTLIGVELLQATETEEAAFAAAAYVENAGAGAEARQEAWTVAVTLIEALAVAAWRGLTARTEATIPKTRTSDVNLVITALTQPG